MLQALYVTMYTDHSIEKILQRDLRHCTGTVNAWNRTDNTPIRSANDITKTRSTETRNVSDIRDSFNNRTVNVPNTTEKATNRAGNLGKNSPMPSVAHKTNSHRSSEQDNLELQRPGPSHSNDTIRWDAMLCINANGEKMYQCEYCDYRTTKRGNLKMHIQGGLEKISECVCGFKSRHKCELKKHLRFHPNDILHHTYGENTFCNAENWRRYMQIHKEEHFFCKYCEIWSSDKSSMMSHLQQRHEIHSNDNRHFQIHIMDTFYCKLCKYKDHKVIGASNHMRKHTGEKLN